MSLSITCIIPTLNRGPVLCETIRMLQGQSHQPNEIIIVDQTDSHDRETTRVLSAWVAAKSIILIQQREPNASCARNVGAKLATGDVLLFLDDDIQVDSDFVVAHARNYLDPKVVGVSGQVLENGKSVTTKLRDSPDDAEIGWIRFPKNYGKRCIASWVAAGNFSVRRNVYFEVGGMDENYKRGAFREETDFAMRFLQKGYRFQFDPAASIIHLGVSIVHGGGARNWSHFFCWHHYIGDWYFNLRFMKRRSALPLLWLSFRHLVASRENLARPWSLPIAAICWLGSAPIAFWKRLRGARLVKSHLFNIQS